MTQTNQLLVDHMGLVASISVPEPWQRAEACQPLSGRLREAARRSKILIIEDFKSMHELIKCHLADEPYDFLSAYTATAGLALAKSAAVDLVLLDLDLPDINGFDVCRHLKADRATADIAVIFLTASTGFDERAVGLSLQASDFITKPFDPQKLGLRIRTALRLRRLRDQVGLAEPRNEATARGARSRATKLPAHRSVPARAWNPWNGRGLIFPQ